MTDDRARQISAGLLVAAALSLLPGIGAAIQVPIVVLFALIAPGLAATRFLPPLPFFDRLALTVAVSMSFIILVSMLLVAMDRWSGMLTFAELACVTAALVFFPPRRPDEIFASPAPASPRLQSFRPMADVQQRARSADPYERRSGLLELADILDRQGEKQWAADLRAQANEIGLY